MSRDAERFVVDVDEVGQGVTYGPSVRHDGDGYVLTLTTAEGRVEVVFPPEAMYTLWTEVRGVPWPEPDHGGVEDRLVRQLVHYANGADEEMLRGAIALFGGEQP